MVDRLTDLCCRVLQYLRDDLEFNLDYANIQIITDFEQALRNAINRVLPEVNNSGCWFHFKQVSVKNMYNSVLYENKIIPNFVQSIVRFIRSHHLVQLSTTNEDERRILRMVIIVQNLYLNFDLLLPLHTIIQYTIH